MSLPAVSSLYSWVDEVYPACVGPCAPTAPLVDGCIKNDSLTLSQKSPCALKACEANWLDDWVLCINCELSQIPALNYSKYQDLTRGVYELGQLCEIHNGNGLSDHVPVVGWDELNNTVGSNTTTGNMSTATLPSATASTGSGSGGGSNGPNISGIVGGVLGGVGGLILVVGLIVWLSRRQKAKSSKLVHDPGFEIDETLGTAPHALVTPYARPTLPTKGSLGPAGDDAQLSPQTSQSGLQQPVSPGHAAYKLSVLHGSSPTMQGQDAGRVPDTGGVEVPPRYDPTWDDGDRAGRS